MSAAPNETAELRTLLAMALVVVSVLTLAWVAHNVGIHRRKGPRRSVPAVHVRHEADFNGRRLDADWAALASARRIDIVLDGDRKRFVDVSRPRPRGLLAAEVPAAPVLEAP